MTSSGFEPGASSKRVVNPYLTSLIAPLPVVKVPLPSLSPPVQRALARRVYQSGAGFVPNARLRLRAGYCAFVGPLEAAATGARPHDPGDIARRRDRGRGGTARAAWADASPMRNLLPLILLVPLVACATATDDAPGLGGGGKSDEFAAAADVDVEQAFIDGSMLSLEVAYLGGDADACAMHDFILDWDETYTDATPAAGVVLELLHDRNGDTCGDRVWTVLHFDLAGLATAYADDHGVDSAAIPVTVTAGEEEYGLMYSF
jgi:hypothetical protein